MIPTILFVLLSLFASGTVSETESCRCCTEQRSDVIAHGGALAECLASCAGTGSSYFQNQCKTRCSEEIPRNALIKKSSSASRSPSSNGNGENEQEQLQHKGELSLLASDCCANCRDTFNARHTAYRNCASECGSRLSRYPEHNLLCAQGCDTMAFRIPQQVERCVSRCGGGGRATQPSEDANDSESKLKCRIGSEEDHLVVID